MFIFVIEFVGGKKTKNTQNICSFQLSIIFHNLHNNQHQLDSSEGNHLCKAFSLCSLKVMKFLVPKNI